MFSTVFEWTGLMMEEGDRGRGYLFFQLVSQSVSDVSWLDSVCGHKSNVVKVRVIIIIKIASA